MRNIQKWTTVRAAVVCALIMSVCSTAGWAAEELTELDDMVVTGTRTEKKLADVPVRTELIKRAEIEEIAARTLADAVEFTPGIMVENNCQNCNFSQLRMLGLEGPYSQILIDGQPLMSSVAAVYGIEHIPARMIERIEIVKGGGSALYGPGSVAGVVNVITREPTETGASFEAIYEDIDGELSASGSIVGDVVTDDGKTSVTGMGQVDTRDGYDRDGDGYTEVSERDMQSGGIKLRQYVGDDASLTLGYTYTHEERRGGDLLDRPVTEANIAEWIETFRHAGSLTWSHAPSEAFDYRLTGAFADTERDTYYGAGQDPNAFGNSENPIYILDSQFNHYFNSHILTWGAQYQMETLKDEQPAYDRITDVDYEDVGIYVQDDWEIIDAVSLVYGGRVDKHSEIDDAIASPRVALRWKPMEELNIRAAYATGFRAPQLFDEDLHITQAGGEGQIIRNDPNLKEESSASYSLDVEWTPKVGPGYVLVEAMAFYTELKDAFSLDEQDDPTTDEAEFVRINRGGAQVYGAEFDLGYQIGEKFEARLGWVHQKAEFDDLDDDFGTRDFFRTPEDYGVAKLSWKDPRYVDLFIGARFLGEMKVPHYAGYIEEDRLETSDSFVVFDVSASRTFPMGSTDMTLTLGCKNFTDEFQEDLDQGPDRDAGYVYGPRTPRTIYASMGFDF